MDTIVKSVFCKTRNCHTELFASKAAADNFISFNFTSGERDNHIPRSVYCPLCAGWHLTDTPADEDEKSPENMNVLFSLEELVNELKISFDKEHSHIWKPRLDEARTWLAQLEEDESLSTLLVEAKRQLVHYNTIVENTLKRRQKKTGIARNKLKKLADDIRRDFDAFKVAGCTSFLKPMNEWMNHPGFAMMDEKEQEEWETLYDNLADEELMERLSQAALILKTVRVGMGTLPTEQLKMLHENLSRKLEPCNGETLHSIIRNPFKREIENIYRLLKFRGTDYLDPKTGQDKTTITLQKQVEWCNRKFEEVEQTLSGEDTTDALYILQSVDERIRNFPFCKEKVMILERMVGLSRKCI